MPVDRFLHPRCGHSVKIAALNSDQYRVWTQYILSADDFGVMRYSAITLRDENAYLESKPEKVVSKWLDAVVASGLIHTFTHQGRAYVYQRDWQTWQKVEYPRATLAPCPPIEEIAECDEFTQLLFQLHPGGRGERFVWPRKKSSARPEKSPDGPDESSTNARAQARVVANGKRPSANGSGSEGGLGEPAPRMDRWWLEAVDAYPEARRSSGFRAQQAFVDEMSAYPGGPHVAWAKFRANLAVNIASHEWRVKGMIPYLDKYLADGRWKNTLPASGPAAERLSATTQATMEGAAEFIAEGRRGA